MTHSKQMVLGLDVGERRIGLALGDTVGRLAHPLTTLQVDGTEMVRLQSLLLEHQIDQMVVGLPRNLSGDETRQSQVIRQFAQQRLAAMELPIAFQDESVTSVIAEAQLKNSKKSYQKADVDAHAAALILQDYLEGVRP